mgnify:CR=1 FL=1
MSQYDPRMDRCCSGKKVHNSPQNDVIFYPYSINVTPNCKLFLFNQVVGDGLKLLDDLHLTLQKIQSLNVYVSPPTLII